MSKALDTYDASRRDQWQGDRPLQHASGIWGRIPMLELLSHMLKEGDRVIDLGCGGGYCTSMMGHFVGKTGLVVGVDNSRDQLGLNADAGQSPLQEQYTGQPNVQFVLADITERLPFDDTSFDHATSFMVMHNLHIADVSCVCKEANRVVRKGGRLTLLTMHPHILDSRPWDLDFWQYNKADLGEYGGAIVKEAVRVRGIAKNCDGGEKEVFMINHTRHNMIAALCLNGWAIQREMSVWIDPVIALQKFGSEAVRTIPTEPAFWIISAEKGC